MVVPCSGGSRGGSESLPYTWKKLALLGLSSRKQEAALQGRGEGGGGSRQLGQGEGGRDSLWDLDIFKNIWGIQKVEW